MKNIKLKYLLYLICLHDICSFFTISSFLFPKWGKWLESTLFLNSYFNVYTMMIIFIFPALSIVPYYFLYDFPNVSIKKKLTLAGIAIINLILILAYTVFIHKIMS